MHLLERCERNISLGLAEVPFLTSEEGHKILLMLKEHMDDYFKPQYDPKFGDQKTCVCGHPYERHFDGYEDNRPVGCKYCPCCKFIDPSKASPENKLAALKHELWQCCVVSKNVEQAYVRLLSNGVIKIAVVVSLRGDYEKVFNEMETFIKEYANKEYSLPVDAQVHRASKLVDVAQEYLDTECCYDRGAPERVA